MIIKFEEGNIAQLGYGSCIVEMGNKYYFVNNLVLFLTRRLVLLEAAQNGIYPLKK